jgi:hypothetical protein
LIILVVSAATLFLNKILAQESFAGMQCEPRFSAISFYYEPSSNFGFEFTRWAAEAKFSYGFGMQMIQTKESYMVNREEKTREYYTGNVYLYSMYRINRYLHPIVSVGIKELDQFTAHIGLRSVIPLFGGVSAFWVEPGYGTEGGQMRVAYSLALIPRRRSPL